MKGLRTSRLFGFFGPATIPLDRDATGRFLPAVVAIMVLLATLLLVGAVTLGDGLRGWRSDLEGRVTVQILPLDSRVLPLPERVEQALRLLRLSPLVVEATPVPDKDLAAMLAPWLGDGPLPEDLPVPALIDVVLKPGANVVDSLRDLLKPVAGAALDDHGSWLRDVQRLAGLVAGLTYGLVGLIVGAAALIIVLLVRAGMAMHRDAVELLHLVGATDRLIAWQFQRHMSLVALRGAVAGTLVAALLLALLRHLATRAGLALFAGLAPTHHLGLLVLVPGAFVGLAALTSGLVARRLLAELP